MRNEKKIFFICISLTAAGLVVEMRFEHKSANPEIHIHIILLIPYILLIGFIWNPELEKSKKDKEHVYQIHENDKRLETLPWKTYRKWEFFFL